MAAESLAPTSRSDRQPLQVTGARSYELYGLRIDSDGDIPGLTLRPSSSPADVIVQLNSIPKASLARPLDRWYQSKTLNQHGRPALTVWRVSPQRHFLFAYDDGTEFLIARDGSQVCCWWQYVATIDDAAVHLRGPVLAFVLRLKGVLCLHASAVAVDGFAVAILGAAGTGKFSRMVVPSPTALSISISAFIRCAIP